MAARGPRVRRAVPETVRRNRSDGALGRRRREEYLEQVAGRGPGPARPAAHRRRSHRKAEALLVDLRENGRRAAKSSTKSTTWSACASSSSPSRTATARSGSIHAVVAARPGPFQGLRRDAQVQPLPVVAHDGGRSRGQAVEFQIRTERNAPPRRVRRRRALGLQGAAQPDRRSRVAPTHRRLAAGHDRPGEFMQSLKIDLEQDEVFVFTPKGRVITLPTGATPVDFAYAIHTEVGHRCIGARVNGRLVPLESPMHSGETCRDLHEQGRRRRTEPRLAADSSTRPGPVTKIRQWFPESVASRRDRRRPRGARQGIAPRRDAGTEAGVFGRDARQGGRRRSTTPTSTPCTPRSASTTCRPRRSCSASQRDLRGGEEQLPVTVAPPASRAGPNPRPRRCRRPRRGPRRRDGAPVAVLHAGPRRRDHGLRHPRSWRVACTAPTAPTRRACRQQERVG